MLLSSGDVAAEVNKSPLLSARAQRVRSATAPHRPHLAARQGWEQYRRQSAGDREEAESPEGGKTSPDAGYVLTRVLGVQNLKAGPVTGPLYKSPISSPPARC
jgi:hypothetical protein